MNYKKALGWGIAIWIFAFAVSFIIFPLHENDRIFFESIMPVAVALATTFAATKFLKNSKNNQASLGLKIGLIWLVINIIIDLFLFLPANTPFSLTFSEYIKDIGFTYQ
ncbi:hypothetical protein KC644_00460 [Candidatus Berkelbacteria bacterium]|nr:hypothetical protein [Candidatus Berkelbacteria bacterium]